MTLVQGQIIQGRYRIVGLIAQGGFGAVYKGWDVNLNRPIAVKENLDTSPEAQRQFTHEAQILSSLSHPNLPRVTDHFFVSGVGQYLVMDFVDGEDLQQMLNRQGRPFAETQVLPWIEQVCDALEYLHQQNPPIIHRDIKPANIKITPDGRVVLVDFGISKILNPASRTTMGARAVTPGYSAPEQYGRGTTDQRSDVYSLGATLYALLTGQEPPESIERLANGITLVPPRQLVPTISAASEAAVLKACEPTTTQRLGSIREFRQFLTSQVGSTASYSPPISTARYSGSTPVSTPAINRSWLMAAGLVAIAIVVAAFILRGSPSAATPTATAVAVVANTPAATDEPPASPTAVPTIQPTASPTARPHPPSTLQQTATPALPAGVIFYDDFNSKSTSETKGWSTDGGTGVTYQWQDGNLRFTLSDSNKVAWNSFSHNLVDFGAEVVAQPATTLYAEYGLVFRAQFSTPSSYYLFGVSTDGDYFLSKRVDGVWADKPIGYTMSKYVKGGQARNTLAVLARGSDLYLFVNGFQVDQVKDTALSTGEVGLYIGSGDSGSIRVDFEEFSVFTASKAASLWGADTAAHNPTATPPKPAAPAVATRAPAQSTNATVTVRSTFDQTCRIVMWGPADVTIDVGKDQSATQSVKPGTYGWRAFIGGGETGQASDIKLSAGSRCQIFCDATQRVITRSAGCG